MAALAVAFVVSGVGNMLGHADAERPRRVRAWPTWLSPIGWGYELRPFGGDHWWLLMPSVALAGVLLFCAGRYAARRDLGRGRDVSADRPRPGLGVPARAVRACRCACSARPGLVAGRR